MAIVAKYSLNGNTNDSAGSNNGTPTALSYMAWKSWEAGNFNGSTSTIIADAPDYFWTQNLSISCLIKINTLPTSTDITMPISFVETSVDNWIYDKSFDINSSWQISFRVFDWAGKSATFNWLVTWKWYHIVWTFDWTNLRVYVNSVEWTSTTATWTYNFTTPKLWFSWNWWWSRVRFNWLVDEVEIHNTALTPAEIKNKYLFYNWFI